MCPDKVVSKYQEFITIVMNSCKYLMALVLVFIRPQLVDYWFLISRPHGFSAIEFYFVY